MAVWSEINCSKINRFGRSDAEYYQPSNQNLYDKLINANPEKLKTMAFITDGIHASPDIVTENGVRYISAKCVRDNSFIIDNCIFISKHQNDLNLRTQLKKHDVIITTVGTIGNVAVVNEEIIPSNCDRHVGIIRVSNNSDISPYYISTFLNSKYGRFQSLRESAGNVQLNLYISNIGKILIPRFGNEERTIAKITQTAYEKRELSKSLYIQAQELLNRELGLNNSQSEMTSNRYESSFCELMDSRRFDSEYYNPKVKQIVKRISSKKHSIIKKHFHIKNGFPWNSKKFLDDNSGVPVIRIRDVKPTYIDNDVLSSIETKYCKAISFPKGQKSDIVIGMDGLKYFYAALIEEPCSINQRVCHLTPRQNSNISSEYATFMINSEIGQAQLLRDMTIATTVGRITNRDIAKLILPIVSDDFHNSITNLIRKSINAKKQSKQLLEQAKRRVEELIEQAVRK